MHTATHPFAIASDMLALRTPLLRFAQRRLHCPHLAEDAVHDVFEAVLQGRARFAGRSSLRTWLTGVLKHKMADLLRQTPAALPLADDDTDAALQTPCPQPLPDEVAAQRERLRVVALRLQQLTPGLREAVELRLVQELSTEEVCERLGISETNLFVRLHRARKLLAA